MPIGTKQASDTEELRRRNRGLTVLNAFAKALDREVDLCLAATLLVLEQQTRTVALQHAQQQDAERGAQRS